MMHQLVRETYATSRSLDYLGKRELQAQIGHPVEEWPLVLLKELLDNALDACEDSGVAPEIEVYVDDDAITVIDNGPGLPADVVARFLDFSVRVSSREAWVSPSRGAQGNAWKTLIGMPYALDPDQPAVIEIAACGIRHKISIRVDQIRQQPVIDHVTEQDVRIVGTEVLIPWSSDQSSKGQSARFYKLPMATRLSTQI